MKIAQVNVFFKPFMVGGAEWYVYNISRRLAKMGHDVHVYTVNRYNGETAPAEEEIERVNVHRLPMSIDWSYRLKVWKGLKEELVKGRFDVIHAYDYPTWHTRTAMSAAKTTNAASALTVFDVHSMIPRSFYKQLPMKLFERVFARRILNSADRVLVRAPTLLPSLERIGVKREKMIVTPSGINDESLESFDGNAFKAKYGISGSPLLLCLSRLNPLKGPQHLLAIAPKILGRFPDASFVFVGPDQSGYIEHLKTLAKSFGIEKRVYFTGAIYDFTQKMQAYASCDVFVLPTTYEGTSQAIFEAMAHGKPIVATDVGGIPSQIENGRDGVLVPYGDDTSLAASILELLEKPAVATRMGSNAKEKVRNFRYSVLSAELAKIYDDIKANQIKVPARP